MSVTREEWRGLVAPRLDPQASIEVVLPLEGSQYSSSGVFRARASDGRYWWVKVPHDTSGARRVAVEYIISGLGALIGSPVCESAVIRVTEDFDGWEYSPGRLLRPCLAHASLVIPGAIEDDYLAHRADDDNRRRHMGVVALYDWCWGSDDQWLYATTDDNRLYSHDHGDYLCHGETDWNEANLLERAAIPRIPTIRCEGLLQEDAEMFADRLQRVTREEIAMLLRSVSASWQVGDSDLETVGFFIEFRAREVASRLRAMQLTGGLR